MKRTFGGDRRHHGKRGAVLIETVASLGVTLVVVLAALQIAIALYYQAMTDSTSYLAARTASRFPDDPRQQQAQLHPGNPQNPLYFGGNYQMVVDPKGKWGTDTAPKPGSNDPSVNAWTNYVVSSNLKSGNAPVVRANVKSPWTTIASAQTTMMVPGMQMLGRPSITVTSNAEEPTGTTYTWGCDGFTQTAAAEYSNYYQGAYSPSADDPNAGELAWYNNAYEYYVVYFIKPAPSNPLIQGRSGWETYQPFINIASGAADELSGSLGSNHYDEIYCRWTKIYNPISQVLQSLPAALPTAPPPGGWAVKYDWQYDIVSANVWQATWAHFIEYALDIDVDPAYASWMSPFTCSNF